MKMKAFTTYEIAAFCQVTPRTVIQWVNEGKLKAYRTPGNHSRVTREEFFRFLNHYNMPIPESLNSVDKRNKVLVVDDDKVFINLVTGYFKKHQLFEIETAYDGFEAGEKFASFKPDLVVIDIHMPGIDGLKLCSRIRSNSGNKEIMLLVVSAGIDEVVVASIRQAGANDYLAKPISTEILKYKMLKLLGRRQESGHGNDL